MHKSPVAYKKTAWAILAILRVCLFAILYMDNMLIMGTDLIKSIGKITAHTNICEDQDMNMYILK